MRIAILTTDTPHHCHFVREISARWSDVHVFAETASPSAPFETAHAFEAGRDALEFDQWFDGHKVSLTDFADTAFFPSMNDGDAVTALGAVAPDAIVVFGTGILREPVISVCPETIYNLHGGDPESYRGLDTHMWAIYHREFDELVTTIHKLNPRLDDGDIIHQAPIATSKGMPITELRLRNTKVCVDLAVGTLAAQERLGLVPGRPQRAKGRYYSHMPAALKDICVRRFHDFTRGLP